MSSVLMQTGHSLSYSTNAFKGGLEKERGKVQNEK